MRVSANCRAALWRYGIAEINNMLPLIASLQNPKIKNLVKLRERRERDRQKLMLIDGERALSLALLNNFSVEIVFFREDSSGSSMINKAHQNKVLLQPVSADVFEKISYGNTTDPFVGLAPQPDFTLDNLLDHLNPLYLIAEGLEKPGNLGAILRTVDAAGVTGLILCDSHTDIYNHNVIHASRGAFFTVPMARTSSAAAIQWLKERGIQVLSASPDAPRLYSDIDLGGPTAIAVGAEHSGLSASWLHETLIKIPMTGQVDSLNVAQTASILIFEAVRQRLAAKSS